MISETALESAIQDIKSYRTFSELIEINFVVTLLENVYLEREKEQLVNAYMRGKENKYISPEYFYKIEKRFWIIPIEDLGFSVRAYNVLKNMKVSNLGDIIKMSELDLIMQRNCGEKTISEIKVLLCKYEIESQKK